MNKNTRRRLKAYRKDCKKNGFPAFLFKKRAQPFPRIRSHETPPKAGQPTTAL